MVVTTDKVDLTMLETLGWSIHWNRATRDIPDSPFYLRCINWPEGLTMSLVCKSLIPGCEQYTRIPMPERAGELDALLKSLGVEPKEPKPPASDNPRRVLR